MFRMDLIIDSDATGVDVDVCRRPLDLIKLLSHHLNVTCNEDMDV